MQQLQAEMDRARRLAAASYDSRLAEELSVYAAELERQLVRARSDRAARDSDRIDL